MKRNGAWRLRHASLRFADATPRFATKHFVTKVIVGAPLRIVVAPPRIVGPTCRIVVAKGYVS